MSLADAYGRLKPAVVAITDRRGDNPHFPRVIGTGFVINAAGVVATNLHVAEALFQLEPLAGFEGIPATALLFVPTDDGLGGVTLEIKEILAPQLREHSVYSTPRQFDLALLLVSTGDLPSVEIETDPMQYIEGMQVGCAGFPFGQGLLQASGVLGQIGPTLTHGVLASVNPFPCDNPHALLLDITTHGGSSGSPVFAANTGKVVGVNSATFAPNRMVGPGGEEVVLPTGLATAVPSTHLDLFFKQALEQSPELRRHIAAPGLSLGERLASGNRRMMSKGETFLVPAESEESLED